MKKAMLAALIAALLMTLAIGASAAPYVTNGSYESYLGESNHLYLLDPAGGAKVLRATIVDLVGMDDQQLYCLTAEGRLYAIKLDGSSTAIVSAAPTAEDIEKVASKPVYTLENGVLALLNGGTAQPFASNVLAAAYNGVDVYYIQQGTTNTLFRVNMASPVLMRTEICAAVDAPVSLIATQESVTMVAGDHSIIIVNLQDSSRRYEAATSVNTAAAVYVNGQLFRYTQDANGHYLLENVMESELRLEHVATATPRPTATPTPTRTPTPTPKPTKTPKPTATPIPEDDENIYYGERGSEVKAMQKRLLALGYPVGGADGVFGKNTLIALNLFQGAVDYIERDYATESLLNRLYRYDAPPYDPIAPLKKGDTGMAVKLMQQALQDQGYGPAKVDGIYGNDTREAVRAFQKAKELKITGKADSETLALLYDLPGGDSLEPTVTPGSATDLIIQHK